jgi:hypothetical protein
MTQAIDKESLNKHFTQQVVVKLMQNGDMFCLLLGTFLTLHL